MDKLSPLRNLNPIHTVEREKTRHPFLSLTVNHTPIHQSHSIFPSSGIFAHRLFAFLPGKTQSKQQIIVVRGKKRTKRLIEGGFLFDEKDACGVKNQGPTSLPIVFLIKNLIFFSSNPPQIFLF